MLRDGDYCLLTEMCFFPPTFVSARCAHIIPFSIHSKVALLYPLDSIPYLYISLDTNIFGDRDVYRLRVGR